MDDDVSTITCFQHDKELYMSLIGGVPNYSHDDGTDCEINNRFDTSVQEILDAMALHDKHALHQGKETIELSVAMIVSLPFRLRFYRMLSKLDDPDNDTDKIQHYLRVWARITHGAHNEKTLQWEMKKVFGSVVFENIGLFSNNRYAGEEPAHPYPLPRYDNMLNVENVREDNYILDLKSDVAFAKERYRRFDTERRS